MTKAKSFERCARCNHSSGDHWPEGPCGHMNPDQSQTGEDCSCAGFVDPEVSVHKKVGKSRPAKSAKPIATELTPEIKYWFGDGEVDVDLMLAFGAVTKETILELWNREGRFTQERRSDAK